MNREINHDYMYLCTCVCVFCDAFRSFLIVTYYFIALVVGVVVCRRSCLPRNDARNGFTGLHNFHLTIE